MEQKDINNSVTLSILQRNIKLNFLIVTRNLYCQLCFCLV